jgi:hypothetical protein
MATAPVADSLSGYLFAASTIFLGLSGSETLGSNHGTR